MKKCGKCGSKKTKNYPQRGQVRPSCFECVEKHWCAAKKLLEEILDGYDFRCDVIAELTQAEAESQAWTELHDSFRIARKNWQRSNEVPDFIKIQKQMEKIWKEVKNEL